MQDKLSGTRIQEIKDLLLTYFPDCRTKPDPACLLLEDEGDVLSSPEQILPYMQTVFFEEHLLEVQFDQSTRRFFTNLVDDLPELKEESGDDDPALVESQYEPASYLKASDSLVIAPLTPGIGNVQICHSERIICRFFSGTNAIEFGCTFRSKDTVRGEPLLRLNFPVIGRVNKGYRQFRVKALSSVAADVIFHNGHTSLGVGQTFRLVDVSAMGLGFEMQRENQPFDIGELIEFTVRVEELKELSVRGSIRNVSKVRGNKGYKHICGVQFDLETRSLAAEIEQLSAAIQRLRLREISDKMNALEGVSILR